MKKKPQPGAKVKSAFDRDYVIKGKTAVYRGKGGEIDLNRAVKEMDKRGLKVLKFE